MHNFFEAWKLYDVQMPKHKTLPDCQSMLELFSNISNVIQCLQLIEEC
jgi:hypothetical protein